METKELMIKRNKDGRFQHLMEILPEIPSNVILHKTITGIGATYSELKARRHSIIIEPNVPVIVGKCQSQKHKEDNLLGVYESVYRDKIVAYLEKTLNKSEDKYVKILTTPESFQKVKEAFEEVDENIYQTCFLLFDECHKIVKDADYRETITLPIDDFFHFAQKAMVSATPLVFTDKRFEKQKFKILKVVPDSEYRIPLNLLHTNNTLAEIRFRFLQEEGRVCFFVNSTDMVYSLMNQLDILENSAVFCSAKSVKKLKEKKFKPVYDQWEEGRMKHYNFFTSRFYNAVDMELEEKPVVVMVSDVYFSDYTMIDPHTDAIQIVGRFRNGTKTNYHLYNTNPELPVRSEEDIQDYLSNCEYVYQVMKQFRDTATSAGARDAYEAALKLLPFNKMLDKYGKKNYFTIDNYRDDVLLRSVYNNDHLLVGYYNDTQRFDIYWDEEMFPLGDCERLKRENRSASLKERRKEIVRQLELLKGRDETSLLLELKRDLQTAYPLIYEAYEVLGKEEIEKLKYSKKRITEALILHKYRMKTSGTEFIQLLKNSFQVGGCYTLSYIKKELSRIYQVLDIQSKEAVTAQTIKKHFDTRETKIKGSKGLQLLCEKF